MLLALIFIMLTQSAFALDSVIGAKVNWVEIPRTCGHHKIECEVEKSGVTKYFHLNLKSDGSMSDFAKTVYATLMAAKSSGQNVHIASDDGQTYIEYLYLKDN